MSSIWYSADPFQVTDQCPGCGKNHLDLYEDAFTKLAAKSKGVINVNWDFVECPITVSQQIDNT